MSPLAHWAVDVSWLCGYLSPVFSALVSLYSHLTECDLDSDDESGPDAVDSSAQVMTRVSQQPSEQTKSVPQ